MRMRAALSIATLLFASSAAASDPEIKAVTFQRCVAKASCSELTRWSETTSASPLTHIRVEATISNSSNYDDAFFLLTTTEYMITPLYAYSVVDLEKLKTGNEVSWSQLTTDADMRALVLHGLHRESQRNVTLRILNLQTVLRISHADPADYMWPWLVRVTARLVDRQGQTVSTQSGILELVPAPTRTKASSQQPAQH